MFELIKRLCEISAPTGREGAMRDFLVGRLNSHAQLTVAPGVGVIAHKPGEGKRIMLCVNTDEPSFVVKSSADGFSKFEIIGKASAAAYYGKRIAVEGVQGVVNVCPIHLTADKGNYPKPDAMQIYSSQPLEAGSFGTFSGTARTFGQDGFLVKGKAVAARSLIAAMLSLADVQTDSDLWLVFSDCGAVGAGGARAAAELIRPQQAILLTCFDNGVFDAEKPAKIGLPLIDSGAVHNAELVNSVKSAAQLLDIETVIPSARLNSPASAVSQNAGGVRTALLALPARMIGSCSEYCRIKDVQALSQLLRSIV